MNEKLFDLDLIKKHDKSGPRYTSYPTAPMFHEGIGAAEYISALSGAATKDSPLSLYVHVPFCNTVCYFCGCSKIATKKYERAQPYLDLLYKEIDTIAALVGKTRSVTQLHLGGGTPTFLSNQQIKDLISKLRDSFSFVADEDAEYSIEIDPRETTEETVKALREAGFNRMSMGVQDFNPIVQKAVNRIQSKEVTLQVLNDARKEGFKSINIDLMYGLPHQTVTTFDDTLDQIIAFSPDRIALFNYAHLPEMFMPQRRIDEAALPLPQEKLKILERSIQKLTDAGYVFIGMDHFAKPNDELTLAQKAGKLYRNFQGYSTHAECDLIGLGLTSIGYVGGNFFQNQKDMETYTLNIEENGLATKRGYALSEEDLLRKGVIMKLMCDFSLDFSEFEKEYHIEFRDYFKDALVDLQGMQEDGLLSVTSTGITVLPSGRLMVRNVAMVFDAYLRGSKKAKQFSKVL